MKKFKRLLLRPLYAIYWGVYKLKYPRIIADGKARPQILNFNLWLVKNGFWRLDNTLDNFKTIIPNSYREALKTHPFILFAPYIPSREVKAQKGKTVFTWYEHKKPLT